MEVKEVSHRRLGYTGKKLRSAVVATAGTKQMLDTWNVLATLVLPTSDLQSTPQRGWRISCRTTQSAQERAWRAHMEAEKNSKGNNNFVQLNQRKENCNQGECFK